jgi:hypothetical protein
MSKQNKNNPAAVENKPEISIDSINIESMDLTVLLALQKKIAEKTASQKNETVSRLEKENAEYEAKIEANKVILRQFGVGLRGRKPGTKNTPKASKCPEIAETEKQLADEKAKTMGVLKSGVETGNQADTLVPENAENIEKVPAAA